MKKKPDFRNFHFVTKDIYLISLFVLCRLSILLFYEAYVSDVSYYLDIAKQGLEQNAKAYQDFSFGYPPLALVFVYIPAWIAHLEFWSYWRAFRIQMFLVDLALFGWVYWYLRAWLQITVEKVQTFVVLYCLFGFLQGHLLYDRLDLLTLASLFGLLFIFTTKSSNLWAMRAMSLLGAFIKFVPLFYALLLNLVTQWSQRTQHTQNTGTQRHRIHKMSIIQLTQKGVLELFWLIAPFFLLIGLYEVVVAKGVFTDLNMHFQRGIQVESTWATPLVVAQLLNEPTQPFAVNNFGAQHIDESKVPLWYLEGSKWVGLLSLLLFGLYLFFGFLPKHLQSIKLNPKQEPVWLTTPFVCLIWINIFCLFLSTQRVLSPQFFIWLMIPLALLPVFLQQRTLVLLSILTYSLTYIGFDLGYWKFVAGDPWMVAVVSLRNLFLILLTVNSLLTLKRLHAHAEVSSPC